MENKKYVAYVGTYTHGSSKGLQVYDVNVRKRNSHRTEQSRSKEFFSHSPLQERSFSYSD